MSHVFLSYSRSDRALATRVCADLAGHAVEVWSDRRLGLGGSWLAEIGSAIDRARVVVLLATPNALASKWVMREVEAAQALGKSLVPVLAGGSRFGDLPASLAGINGLDLADGYDDAIKAIADAFVGQSRPETEIVPSATLPVLLLITADNQNAEAVARVARSVGLAVVRYVLLTEQVVEVAAYAHIVVLDTSVSDDGVFLAGYVSGRGGRVIWVAESVGRLPAGAGVRVCSRDAADLEREICGAAFLPRRSVDRAT